MNEPPPKGNRPCEFQPDEEFARELDRGDPLASYRDRFFIPKRPDGGDAIYFAGNSLGLQPQSVGPLLAQELRDWAALAVDAHFKGKTPWYSYHEIFRESGARLVGAQPVEVVMMNSLTVNLHLMMATFYRPTRDRFKILVEDAAFPSDTYAVKSQLRYHGFDAGDGLIVVRPRPGEFVLRPEDIEQIIDDRGHEIALVLMAGVHFFTGQFFDIPRITAAAQRAGCVVGWDLAHAAGNVPLRLHAWGVDFACWCSYKYLNAGPGAVAGCFVHETHGRNLDLVRLAGWWGNDPDTRFKMHLLPDFIPRAGADGWQVSNPPILSMAPLKASLDLFDEVGMAALRAKSERLTAYLEFLLERADARAARGMNAAARTGAGAEPTGVLEIITPRDPARRGCQLSIMVHDRARERFDSLSRHGIVCDFREPNVIRAAPVPLYNTFHDVWAFARGLTAGF